MKKVFSVIMLCGLLLSTPTYAYVVEMIKHGGITNIPHKSPARPWLIDLEEGELLFGDGTTSDYTLQLINAEDEVIYTCVVPAGTTSVVLPSTLTGNYELRLVGENYYYFGFIEL